VLRDLGSNGLGVGRAGRGTAIAGSRVLGSVEVEVEETSDAVTQQVPLHD
jgi:hypothetical protein